MRLLLTSSGIRNASIQTALTALLGRPFADAKLALLVTAAVGQAGDHSWLVDDLIRTHRLGWGEFNIVELNGLPKQMLVRRLEHADVIYAEGGNAYHLARSILVNDLAADFLRLLDHKVYVGTSAGAMIFGKQLTDRMIALHGGADELYESCGRQAVSPFNLFDWHLQPHADLDALDESAGEADFPYYAIDDQSAVQVIDGEVQVVSEGRWKLVNAHLLPPE